jgi:LysM repeat protein
VNHEEPYRNQAERLRKKIEKVKDGEFPVVEKNELPSRTDIHRNKKNKTKLKVKFPIIRLLALFFILLPVGIFSAYSVLGSKEINTNENVSTVITEINVEDSKDVETEGEEITETTESITPNTEFEVIVEEEEEKKETSADQEDSESPIEEETETINPTSPEKENSQTEATNDGEPTTINIVYHTVQPKETLYRIAMQYYQSQSGIEIIQKANNLNGNEILVGQVLKIPK